METRTAVSAGGVIFRRTPEVEVAITERSGRSGFWVLPKGTVEKGESYEGTAVREVLEETGLRGEPVDKIGTINYWFVFEGVRYHKYVHFFLLKYIEGSTSAHDWEVSEVAWLPTDTAIKRLTHRNEREILEKAGRMLLEFR